MVSGIMDSFQSLLGICHAFDFDRTSMVSARVIDKSMFILSRLATTDSLTVANRT